MKRILSGILIVLFLSGCAGNGREMDRVISLRRQILESDGCAFLGNITADYGDKIYNFTLDCRMDNNGKVHFKVVEPNEIKDISGSISSEGGKLTFDDKALFFNLLADGQISPVALPWIFTKTLRSGYIKGCAATDSGLYIQINDSYAEDALHMDIWTDQHEIPVRAELLWQGRRILSMGVENFRFM